MNIDLRANRFKHVEVQSTSIVPVSCDTTFKTDVMSIMTGLTLTRSEWWNQWQCTGSRRTSSALVTLSRELLFLWLWTFSRWQTASVGLEAGTTETIIKVDHHTSPIQDVGSLSELPILSWRQFTIFWLNHKDIRLKLCIIIANIENQYIFRPIDQC